jgi:tRNA(Ile)-lysidine synthase
VDHGLRARADAELHLAAETARTLGVEFSRSTLALDAGGNLQARARAARYAALDTVAKRQGARWVATAHHADDRAETVLIRLLRGGGCGSFAVLPACSPGRLRPLMRSPRSAVMAHLERHRLAWAEDPSNRDRRLLRSRVRYELLPLLESLSPTIREHLARLADEAADREQSGAPFVTDAGGARVAIGARHVRQIRQARKLSGARSHIWLPGGLELTLQRGRPDAINPSLQHVQRPPPTHDASQSSAAGADAVRSRKKPRPGRQIAGARGAKAAKSD